MVESSYPSVMFGGRRKGKRGREAEHKVPVFGMSERDRKVYVEVVSDVQAKTLVGAARQHIYPGSTTCTDGFSSYSSLLLYGYEHIRVDHERCFANGKVHINGLEGFRSYAKERLAPYHGVSPRNFYLYIKEMEFRYNHRDEEGLFEHLIKEVIKPVPSTG